MSEPTSFLYPFIDSEERDSESLLSALVASARDKTAVSERLAAETLRLHESVIRAAGRAMAAQFEQGGKLFCIGNGGSSTDAATVAALFVSPGHGRSLPAMSLAADSAVLTALANDVGFELVFLRQLIAHARSGDMVLALSTSGNSENLLTALEHARHAGMLTIGIAGSSGGAMASSGDVDHLVVVPSDSVHRIQETQAVVTHRLWREIQITFDTKTSPDERSQA